MNKGDIHLEHAIKFEDVSKVVTAFSNDGTQLAVLQTLNIENEEDEENREKKLVVFNNDRNEPKGLMINVKNYEEFKK